MKKFFNLDELTEVVKKYPARLGICVNFDEQQFYEYCGTEKFDTACSIMVFILLEYVHQLFKKKLSDKEFLTYTEENFATGSGTIKFLPFGSKIKVEDAVELMIAASDHIAANLLIEALGLDAINKTIERYGFFHTELKKKFLIPKVKNIGTSTPRDYTHFFTALENNQLVSAEASEFMKKILLKQKYKDILSENIFKLPSATFFIDVASKSGKADGKIYDNFTDSYIVDGGIVYTTKGNYEISLFAEIDCNLGLTLNQVKAFMQDLSANFFMMFLKRA